MVAVLTGNLPAKASAITLRHGKPNTCACRCELASGQTCSPNTAECLTVFPQAVILMMFLDEGFFLGREVSGLCHACMSSLFT